MQDVFLIIEQFGSSITAFGVNAEGHVEARQAYRFDLQTPAVDHVEADPYEVWQVAREGLNAVVEQVGGDRIAGVGLVTEPGSAMLWEQTNSRPVGPLVMPSDRRARDLCRTFRGRGWDEPFRRRTGRLPVATAAGFKVHTLLTQTPRGYSRAAQGQLRFGTLDSFLLARLTGSKVHATDQTHALSTQLYSIDERTWDIELLQVFNVPRACLPTVLPPDTVAGETTLGGRLSRAVPIGAVLAVSQAALQGTGVTTTGMTRISLEDLVQLHTLVGPERVRPTQSLGETFALGPNGQVEVALYGEAEEEWEVTPWAVRLKLGDSLDEAARLAAQVNDAGGVVFAPHGVSAIPPDATLAIPELFKGLENEATSAHLAHALFESTAFHAGHLVEAVAQYSTPGPIIAGGALAGYVFLRQHLADLVGQPVQFTEDLPLAAYGAAIQVARTIGVEATGMVPHRDGPVVEPRLSASERAARLAAWRQTMEA